MIQTLDRFHRVDASIDLQRVYNDLFLPFPSDSEELPIDITSVFLICEWAVTSQRPAEYRYLSTLSLLEMHSRLLLAYGKEKNLLTCRDSDHQVILQGALQMFLQLYEPKVITEVTQTIELFCLLVRRRLFDIDAFVEFASSVIDASGADVVVMSPMNGSRSTTTANAATVVSTAYNIECAPGRGYKSNDIHLLGSADRLRLYLWQLPRGPFPLPTSLAMLPGDNYDSELSLLRWLEVMDLRREHLSFSKTLERAQSLCVYVFHTHGEASDIQGESAGKDRASKEVDYQGKVGELVSAVKTMSGHDKGRFTLWFLKNIYDEQSFFRFSDFGSVEHIVRLVCLILEIVDILALLEVIIYFLKYSPVFVVKNVVLSLIERHEIAFCAAGQIPFLMQTMVDRFNRLSKAADDKAGSVARFFCKMYYAHAKKKEIGKLDLPFALLRPIAETARKNQDANAQKQKEMALEVTNPIVRIPPPKESLPAEVKTALSKCFKALQAKSFDSSDKQAVSTPLASPDSQGNQNGSADVASFEAPAYSSLVWREIIGEATSSTEAKCRDSAIDYAATVINMSMSTSVATTNANATRERRTPNYVFFLRAVLSEVMDKWMANITARVKTNCRRPIMTPHYVHRCVRLIREVVEQHPDGEDFQEKFGNTLVVWLQKEVLPGFAGSESQKRSRNPFINMENGKEAFVLNQKGRLDKLQYGLKAFLVSLIIHKVLDLPQMLRMVLVPLFPRKGRATRDPPPNLPTQLLAMALVFQLFSEPPQHVHLDPQKLVVMFDEPLTKYHLRFMRSQVPACLMFPLVHLLCQISYQMEENFTLRKREERGTLASITLFNLTSDAIVRDIVFHDTKEAREKHILPVYQKKQWHIAVLLTHFFRPPNSPAEDSNGQVQLLKVEQIMDQMTVWTLNRGGSIYLDLQMSRQQMKVKRATKSMSRQSKRKVQADAANGRSSKRLRTGNKQPDNHGTSVMNGVTLKGPNQATINYIPTQMMDLPSSDDDDVELEFDETSSATEILANLVVLRVLKRSTRPPFLVAPTLYSVSPISTPQLYRPPSNGFIDDGAPPEVRQSREQRRSHPGVHNTALTTSERWMNVATRESREAAVASLYAATVCSISRRAMGSVIAKILQVLEEDVKHTLKEKFSRKLNGTTVVRLICGIMCTPPGSAFLPRYMMSLATQLESIYEACRQYDEDSGTFDAGFLGLLRRKLSIRLQLVAVISQSKHVPLTICYRDRIVKTLFFLMGTSVVSRGVGLSLFSWIIDLIPHVNASVLHTKQFELVESLKLPVELKARVWTVFPRPLTGSTQATYVRNTRNDLHPVDPWGLLEHVPQLPSDGIVCRPMETIASRRRVFRCV
ncbi:hypothetical protein PINS_up003917 [Pythium insidiosum]|nr:hypothetical protein PINS_up003917 [Pythium insidiosum]